MARPRELFAWKPAPANLCWQSKAIYHDQLYFTVWNSSDGIDLWTTDSTDAGTYRVADLIFPRPPYGPSEFVVANDLLFFVLQDSPASVRPVGQ